MVVKELPSLVVGIPVFNDWEALYSLLGLLDKSSLSKVVNFKVIIFDDLSSSFPLEKCCDVRFSNIGSVFVLRLSRNLGHQRAIAVGLAYIYHHHPSDYVVIMDGDGEDNPFEIERLISVASSKANQKIVFAKRSKRSENLVFRIFYFLYRKAYLVLTGKEIRFGNFSLIPGRLLKNVVVVSEIWNHYSAGIHRSRISFVEVAVPRTKRLAGKPKMNLVSLVTHGLSAIAVYGDIVGTRILILIALLCCMLLFFLLIVILIRFFTVWAIPGWATYVSGLLFISISQLLLIGTVFSMVILSTRNQNTFIPIRDYNFFIDECFEVNCDS